VILLNLTVREALRMDSGIDGRWNERLRMDSVILEFKQDELTTEVGRDGHGELSK
jgi:hypothetical protein